MTVKDHGSRRSKFRPRINSISINMNDCTVSNIRTDFVKWNGFLVKYLTVRHLVRIFGTDFFRTVHGMDFGPDSNPVRYVVRILSTRQIFKRASFLAKCFTITDFNSF